jgi:tripartite-type tricarboxylate transporter receptor subunit TctC
LRLTDVAKRLADFAAVPVGSNPDETAAFIKMENGRWRKLIDSMGLKID